jgi:aryl-alcohol dehydrogenase-like predicted oxidoreductase
VSGRRKLGSLEVSAVGLGVQNMSRTYQTTVPSRPEMLNIIRTAFERGVTFYDAAEAYGPHCVQVRLEHRPGDRPAAARAQ